MKINIENFKSIEKLALDLAPLTILIGPPAGGKSNILDAIMLIRIL
jgi:AAA15 family ATPase/GTPase